MSYSRSFADDFLRMPDSVLTEVTERMKVGQANAGSASQGDGSAQSKTSSKTDIPNVTVVIKKNRVAQTTVSQRVIQVVIG